jgi:hypothetical protein
LKPWQAVRFYHIVDALKPRTIFSPKEQSMKIGLTIALAGLFCLDVVPGSTSASEDDPRTAKRAAGGTSSEVNLQVVARPEDGVMLPRFLARVALPACYMRR